MKATFPYRILVEWSAEDQIYVARVPALPGAAAHAPTAEKAAQEAERAARLMLDIRREDGTPPPPAAAH